MEPTKRDWKLFQEKVPAWQEHYMERLLKEYVDYLNSDLPASTKFWKLEKKIKNDKRTPGVCMTLEKSEMFWDIAKLISDGVITMDDIADFNDDTKEAVALILGR